MSRLVLFDFDGTLTTKDSFPLFIKFCKGNSVFFFGFLLHGFSILLYKLGLKSGESLKQTVLSWFFKNNSEAELKERGVLFIEYLFEKKLFHSEILQKLVSESFQGSTVVVVSASPDIWIEPFCKKFNIRSISTKLLFENGKFNGRLATRNCAGKEKAHRIKEAFDLSTIKEIVAYGNSKDDLEMLSIAQEKYWVSSNGKIKCLI